MFVGNQIGAEVALHVLDAFVTLGATQDAEVFVQQGPVQALDEAVGLGSADLVSAVLDVLELEEQLVGVTVGATAELSAIAHWGGQAPPRSSDQVSRALSPSAPHGSQHP